ncbi:MAG TPA: hypothetical protein VFI65_15950 [Streptosporangiaceae bacterium]|nr:hypothetical protein [Streptosporangiaceae bacterium]
MAGKSIQVLGIAVDAELLDRWRGWLMPEVQPFLVPPDVAGAAGLASDSGRLSPELRDSFWLYGIGDRAVCWLARAESRRLPPEVRRCQPAAHRWPSPDRDRDVARVIRAIEAGHRRSRHAEVTQATWQPASLILPAARDLAGSFPPGSGPNCFGTVMSAAGVAGASAAWTQRESFEEWLASSCSPGGSDERAGTVLVWRDAKAEVQHAAVTLGDGWALHKQSQAWMSPTAVLTVQDVILSARVRGHRLRRLTLRA